MKLPWNKNVLLALLFILPFTVEAQRGSRDFKLGFTTSPTFGRIVFDQPSGYTSDGIKTGYSYGIMADVAFTENYFLGTGFTLTTMSGDVRTLLLGGTNETITYKIQYVEIPLALKLKSDAGSRIRFYGQFGPDLGIKVSSKHSLTNLNIKDDAELIRLGLLVGAGTEWKLKTSNVLTGLSFNNPFTKVFKNPDAKNYIVTLNLGVFF